MPRSQLPVLNISPLLDPAASVRELDDLAEDIARACSDVGFFYVVGHGVDTDLQRRLESASRRFFARPLAEKMTIRMELGGRAWRGYFPVGC